ncbi:MAG TPA: fatty acid--CoA ligase [Acidimicrobiales bacterium]|nr:fatty acid--CoA ligase [Acidimicrobiales bacterium]
MAEFRPAGEIVSTMQDFPLTITHLFRHGATVHRRSEVVNFDGEQTSAVGFAEVAQRVERLAAGLASLGVTPGERVATLMWNSQEHLEAYFAVPCMGAVLHTLNLRLAPADLARIMVEAGDKVLLVHASLWPLASAVAPHVPSLAYVVVAADPGQTANPAVLDGAIECVAYEDLLAAQPPGYKWPELEERSAAAICYTSGTTGTPRGVVYSHRSSFLHALSVSTGSVMGLGATERVLPLVPMFHVNAWGIPFAGWAAGATLVMPHRWLLGGPVCKLIKEARPTCAAGVPTIWGSLLAHADEHPEDVDFSSLRVAMSGGSALPVSMMEKFRDRYGVQMSQGWGMTETSPVCAFALVGVPGAGRKGPLSAGRLLTGVEMRIVAPDGSVAPWDGETVGEVEVRGPWVAGSYMGGAEPGQFHDGWLRTGDLGSLDEDGYLFLSDRLKDTIKSGGEWISSMRLEDELMAHPGVLEAAVVGVPDERWGERPLAIVVRRRDTPVSADELRDYIGSRVVRWWAPDHWAFVDELPKTSVGKYDKLALRARYAAGELDEEPKPDR